MTPLKSDDERRSEVIQVRVTREEKEMVREDARRQHQNMSQYLLRLAILEHAKN